MGASEKINCSPRPDTRNGQTRKNHKQQQATLLVRHSLRNHSAMATMNELIIHGTPKLGGWRHQVDIP